MNAAPIVTDHSPRRVVIVGGGITGLAAAYALQEQSRKANIPTRFTLLESSDRFGGKILTEHVGGFTIEGGPDCYIRQKPWATELCQSLGLGGELIGTNDERRKTFVVQKQRLTPLPDGVMLIVPTRITPFITSSLISWPGKLRMGLDFFIPRREEKDDESVGAFVRRRLGGEALDKIAEPLLSGIHVSDPESQSLLATFPRFRALEEQHGSLIRGMLAQKRSNHNHSGNTAPSSSNGTPASMFISLRSGLGELVAVLQEALTEGDLYTGVKVSSLERTQNGFRVGSTTGETWEADAVILAVPAYISADLVSHLDAELSSMLSAIRYVSTATISLAYTRNSVKHPLNGFGYVTPRSEQRQVSACTWSSIKFDSRAPQDGLLLRCFVGGPGREELVSLENPELVNVARRELAEMMGINAQPLFARVYRWNKANPLYDVGHLERVEQIRNRVANHPGVFLCGSAYDGVGIPDCIHQGQQAAEQALKSLSLELA
ncbi:MAG: protoporphyrinogen oxidase [Chloroflexi bacterium]|nr:protoporphyrinogen oxidase [Chloroflexota bacterium]